MAIVYSFRVILWHQRAFEWAKAHLTPFKSAPFDLELSGRVLLADTELAEDEIQNVIACRGAGEGVEAVETFV
jgi:hypothetical protein